MGYDAETFGQRLRRVRKRRDKTLVVVAGLAGMSKSQLHRFETGERSPSLPEIFALAEALQVSASELTRLPIPAPANGHTDSTIKALGLALDAIDVGQPGGVVLSVSAVRDQVSSLQRQRRACQFAKVATELPGLIRNLHTTLATAADRAELLELAVRLHVHVTRLWLVYSGADAQMIRRVAFLALRLAYERHDVIAVATASWGVAEVLLAGDAVAEGSAVLDSLALPPTTLDTARLIGVLHTSYATAALLRGHPEDAASALDSAGEIAGRFGVSGEPDSLGMVFTPTHAELCRMWLAMETGETDRAVNIAREVHPERYPFKEVQAWYWANYGRALAVLPRRREDAVVALRTAERIFPTKVLRDPMVRNALSELLTRAPGGAAGQELRGMAYRAGLET